MDKRSLRPWFRRIDIDGGWEPILSGENRQVPEEREIPLGQAVAMGLVQGPTELLPVSSSAHLSLAPWMAGWKWERIDPEIRKSFEIAVHAGTALALLIGQRKLIASELRAFDGRRASVLLLSFIPPALIGYFFERSIEQRLGGPESTAVGLLAGSAAMVAADRKPQERGRGDADAMDGLCLGLGQAAALAPGVSRNGATLTAARWRGFTREQSNILSRTVALPVIVGAALLKGSRLRKKGVSRANRRALVAGTAASFGSTLTSQALIGLVERDRALWPYALYRSGLAAVTLLKLAAERRQRSSHRVSATSNGTPDRNGDGGGAVFGSVSETGGNR